MIGFKMLHRSVVVFVCIWSALYFEDVSCRSIDEIILEADRQSGMNMDLNQDDGTVLVELDIRYKREDWQEIQQLNAGSDSPRHKRKAIRSDAKRWTNNVVPYRLSNVFSGSDSAQIHASFTEWEKFTCIDFRPAHNNDRNYIFLQNGGGCSSYVGMIGGSQEVSLAPGCRGKSVIVHELGHAIGFQHEQTRPDRDQYVTVYYQNIQSGVEYNFERYTTATVNDFSVPYDYRSVMHYGATAFTANGQDTIRTKDPAFQSIIGSASGLSFRDIKLANIMYSCNTGCGTKSCSGEGFVGKDCNCWCPGNPIVICNDDGDDGDDDDDDDDDDNGECGQSNTAGPHSIGCLMVFWHDTGCKVSGISSPRNTDQDQLQWWNGRTVGEVRDDMAFYYEYAVVNYENYQEKCFGACGQPDTMGPHSLNCLAEFWNEAGCKDSGSSSPSSSSQEQLDWWNGRTVAAVKEDMVLYYQYALTNYENYEEKCFGITCGQSHSTGPHSVGCLNKLWKEAGCSDSGSASPRSASLEQLEWWNDRTVAAVRADMALYYEWAVNHFENYQDKCFG